MHSPVELNAKKWLTTSFVRTSLVYVCWHLMIVTVASIGPLLRLLYIYLSHRSMESYLTRLLYDAQQPSADYSRGSGYAPVLHITTI